MYHVSVQTCTFFGGSCSSFKCYACVFMDLKQIIGLYLIIMNCLWLVWCLIMLGCVKLRCNNCSSEY
ncbi:hypothetical protein RJT34_00499 [Clitoria ternatea]|uniref:Uncharacterized protein n=1 Tax=Clitoria ternatea TaxID=43366 RepID=A0AAN9KID8_CLITE